MFRRLAANAAHGNTLDFSPPGEIRELRRDEMSGARRSLRRRSCRGQRGFSVRLYVVFADAPARSGAFYFVNIDADFTRQPSRVRSGGDRLPVLSASYFAELRRHGERRRTLLRLIGGQRLFFGLSLRTNRRLEREPRSMLA